jgi:hypothetical protein
MSLSDDVEAFAMKHTAHGTVMGDATEETPSGFDLTIRCSCGETFPVRLTRRWRSTTSSPKPNGTDARRTDAEARRPTLYAALGFSQLPSRDDAQQIPPLAASTRYARGRRTGACPRVQGMVPPG